MSLKIRLARGGAKKRPFYRIVIADARSPRDGRFVERIGTFDPLKAKDDALRLVLDVEKAKDWLAKGAQPTDRVLRLLDSVGVAKREPQNNPKKALPKKKAQERTAATEAAAAKAAAAAASKVVPFSRCAGEGDTFNHARPSPSHSSRRVRRRAGRARRGARSTAIRQIRPTSPPTVRSPTRPASGGLS